MNLRMDCGAIVKRIVATWLPFQASVYYLSSHEVKGKQHLWSKLACCLNFGNHSPNYVTYPVFQQQFSLQSPCNSTTVLFQMASKNKTYILLNLQDPNGDSNFAWSLIDI